MKRVLRTKGFALNDLLVAIVACSIAVALLLPALQSIREQSRGVTCERRLTAIGNDAAIHSLKTGRIPSNLGVSGAVRFEDWENNQTSSYWNYQQNASALASGAFSSGRLQLQVGRNPIDPDFWDFDESLESRGKRMTELEGFTDLRPANVPIFLCPSAQVFNSRRGVTIVQQPVYETGAGALDEDIMGALGGFAFSSAGITQYAMCTGASTGGANRHPELARYRGMTTSRERLTFEEVSNSDGLSQTILAGENLGHQRRDLGDLYSVHRLAFGLACGWDGTGARRHAMDARCLRRTH